jgi:5'-nucleotidase
MNKFNSAVVLMGLLGIASTLSSCGSDSSPAPVAAPAPPSASPPVSPPVAATAPFTVKVIGFNDYHGNLESPGTFSLTLATPAAERPAVGGADVIAGHVAKLKSQNPNNVVVAAGDLIGASPLISGAFFDEPAVETLNRIGLEFTSVGNHEFDKGASELQRLQNGGCKTTAGAIEANSCKGANVGTPFPFEGAKFKWLSANVIASATGKPLLPAYGIKTFNGVKMAFIGMTLKATPTIVTPTGVAGLTFQDEAATVNALIPELKAQGISAIGVLVHEGGFQTGSVGDINACEGNLAGSAIADIVKKLDDAVDFVISGHTHAAYNCKLPNARGRAISVTSSSAFGRVLSDIDVTIDPATGDVTAVNATNRLNSRSDTSITPDKTVTDIVVKYQGLISPVSSVVLGSIASALPNTRIDAACNMPTGSLIADAQLAATSDKTFGNATIAFMNGGGVRAGFTFAQSAANEGDGNVTYGEAFTAQPFGNSLVTMTLTAQNIKNALEEQFAGCRGQGATTTRFMLPSAGFKYRWDGAKACDARISNVTLTSNGVVDTLVDATGVVVNPTKTYRVTVNSFMATGGDGYSTFNLGTDLLGGAQDIDALVAFLKDYKQPKNPYDLTKITADAGTVRIGRVGGASCPTAANVNP